ncbi:MAG: potassium-transporting ATPase subunit KdpA, partial [Cyanobacteriota bacterium]
MSYLTQMLGLGVQNFLSAGTGIAVLVVMARGFRNKQTTNLGNFWKDLVKSTLYILLPLSIVFSFILIQQGVVQNFANYDTITTIEGVKQVIPQGPAASQIAIKQLGTNGGGFFGVNSAHPFENPTPLTNFLEMLAILFLPAAFTYTYGKLVGTVKHGWTIFATMMILFLVGLSISLYSEYTYNPVLATSHVMEGKEMRFGMANSILWEVATTSASNGSVNAMHDSLSPLSGMVGMINIMLGEIIFGGVGAGLYGIIIFVILTVFISGLMVGRTPEYLGKKIEAFEIKMVMLGVLLPSSMILIFSAIACVTPIGLSSLTNKGPHGLSEILYAFSSAAGNNGSAFGGLSANTTFYNLSIAFAMLIGRFGVIIPILAIAGSMSNKKIAPTSEGTLSTSNFLFIFMLLSVIIIVGALTFFPALALGPIIEHILMLNAKSF